MATYWKSQPRKFCDFCKCWITDNKPSVDFHEKGKRHQESVRNKIDELKKKGVADAKKKDEENSYFMQMEKDALEAFKKDLANDPELAKQYNVRLKPKKEEEPVYEGPALPGPDYVPPVKEKKKEDVAAPAEDKGEWYEAMSEMGYPYYWNTVTGVPVWEPPEKYVSLAEQGLAPKEEKKADAETESKTEVKPPDVATVADIPLPPGLEDIPLPGETTQSSNPPEPESSSSEEEEEEEGKQDRSSRGVYGTWARVREDQEQVDLQLPAVEETVQAIQIPIAPDEPRIKFKEKRISSLGPSKGNENVTFKKRKLGSGARNVRQRGDDDD